MIKFDNVSFSYGKKQILENLSLSIGFGETVCFFAPSGFGKTTVLRLIMGLEKASSGSVTGTDKKISAVFQEDRLLPHKTVKENIELFADDKNIEELLSHLGLDNTAQLYPTELSGGMARRVAIARALSREADIYIFDEAFNGIDEQNIKNTAECIKAHTKDKTVLIVTHDKKQAELLGARVIDLNEI